MGKPGKEELLFVPDVGEEGKKRCCYFSSVRWECDGDGVVNGGDRWKEGGSSGVGQKIGEEVPRMLIRNSPTSVVGRNLYVNQPLAVLNSNSAPAVLNLPLAVFNLP